MELLEKIGDAASKTCKYTAEKTAQIAKETKLKMKINEYKREIEEVYYEIGKMVYEKSVIDQNIDQKEIKAKCNKIDELTGQIVKCKNEMLSLREKKQCKNCFEEIEKDAKFCPNCGFHQEEEKKKEVEKEETKAENNSEKTNKEEKEKAKETKEKKGTKKLEKEEKTEVEKNKNTDVSETDEDK